MGNAALAEELSSLDELDELYRLDASESEPEDEDEDLGGDDKDDGEEMHPENMPHG
jgi:hypothetical protein